MFLQSLQEDTNTKVSLNVGIARDFYPLHKPHCLVTSVCLVFASILVRQLELQNVRFSCHGVHIAYSAIPLAHIHFSFAIWSVCFSTW